MQRDVAAKMPGAWSTLIAGLVGNETDRETSRAEIAVRQPGRGRSAVAGGVADGKNVQPSVLAGAGCVRGCGYGAAMFDIPGMSPPQRRNLPVSRAQSAPACVGGRAQGYGRERQPRSAWQPRTSAEQWWHYSRGCAAALRAGRPPGPVDVYGPVLEPGEQALLSTEIGYSRYCGTDARYSPLPLIVAGRPAVMFGALAVQGIVNHRRKAAAERNAAVQWRFRQTCTVIVTTDRLICSTAPHRTAW